MSDYDLVGNIAIIKSEKNGKKKSGAEKLREAHALLALPTVKTVLEKASRVKGRLRKIAVRYLLGEKTTVALYKENNCSFLVDVATCYFSPRLANDRKEIAEKIKNPEGFFKPSIAHMKNKKAAIEAIKKTDKVLCLFAGVGVYPVVIWRNARVRKIVAIELSKQCCTYFKKNLKLNKISEDAIEIIQGDVAKKINPAFVKKQGKFDVIVMTRPNLQKSFLREGLLASRKGGRIFYHGFCHEDDLKELIRDLEKEAYTLGKKIKIASVKKIGDIAPYKFRYRIEIKVLD